MPATVTAVDPFDLPEWLGERDVRWTATSSLESSFRVTGELSSDAGDGPLRCDLLAADLAYPRSVLPEEWRARAHHAWSLGEALLVDYDGSLTLVTPGTSVAIEPALDALRRLAKAVGARSSRYSVSIRL